MHFPQSILLSLLCTAALSGDTATISRRAAVRTVDAAVFSSQSSLVLVPVTVTDRHGKTITDLRQEHFQITDNSVPREIVSFSQVEAPVALGVVMDLSASMQRKLPFALEAARAVLSSLGSGDAGYLVTFGKTPSLRVELTHDFGTLANSLLFARADGNTALFDAVDVGLRHGKNVRDLRKALLVVSDGGDNRSRLMESDLIAAAIEADTQIYCIAVHERLRPRDEVQGAHFLERLAKSTGGLKLDVRTASEIPGAAQVISRAMRDQYLIGFKPVDNSEGGKLRKVRVSLDLPDAPSMRVNARRGYFNP